MLFTDVTDQDALNSLQFDKNHLDTIFEVPPSVVVIISKIDIADRKVEPCDIAAEVEKLWKGAPCFECSAKTGQGIDEAMSYIVNQIQGGASVISRVRPDRCILL